MKFQRSSLTTLAVLERKAHDRLAGYYLMHAAQRYIEHCFTLVVGKDPDHPVMVCDDYNEKADPPCKLEPLGMLRWLTNVYEIDRIAPPVPKSSKTLKKSTKNSHKGSRKKPKLSRN
ncbi:hypothetical protein ON010_g13568 [Phytophthora cinnamomi]|nr:hypothetical protein ON010_g13568 [Phytophthora cinnamomi]